MINVSSISKGGGLKALPSFTETISGNTGSFQSVLASLNEEKGRYDTESSRIGSERASSSVSKSNSGKKFHRNAGTAEYRDFNKKYANKDIPAKTETMPDERENKKIKDNEPTGEEYVLMSALASDTDIAGIKPLNIADENGGDLSLDMNIGENDESLPKDSDSGMTGFMALQGEGISASNDDTAEAHVNTDNKFQAVFAEFSEKLNLTGNDKTELNKILGGVSELSDSAMAKLTDKLSALVDAFAGGDDFIEKAAYAILSDIADIPDLENSAAAIEKFAGALATPETKDNGNIADNAVLADKSDKQTALSDITGDIKSALINSENKTEPIPADKAIETDILETVTAERADENNPAVLNAAEKQAADKLITAIISFLSGAEALKTANDAVVFAENVSDKMKAAYIDDTAVSAFNTEKVSENTMTDIKNIGAAGADVSDRESLSASPAFTPDETDIKPNLSERAFIDKQPEENKVSGADKTDIKVSLRHQSEKDAGNESRVPAEKNSEPIGEKNALNTVADLKKEFKTVNVEVSDSLRGESAAKSELQSKIVSFDDINKSLSDNAKSANASLFRENKGGENLSSEKGDNFNYFLKSSAEAQSARNEEIRSQEGAKAYNMREPRDIERLVRNIQSSASKGESKLTVTLTPENLGKLQIQLTEQGGKITAKFLADNESSHKIIMAQSDLLKNQLSEKGIVVDNMEFAFNDAMTKQGTGSEDNGKRSAKAGKGKEIKNDREDLSVGTDVANSKSNGIYA